LTSLTSRTGHAQTRHATCIRGTCEHGKPFHAAKIAEEQLRGFIAADRPVYLISTTKLKAGNQSNYHAKLGETAVAFPTGTADDAPSSLVTTYQSPRSSAAEHAVLIPSSELALRLFHLAMQVPSTPQGELGVRITPNAVLRKAILDTAPPPVPQRWYLLRKAVRQLIRTYGNVTHCADIYFRKRMHARWFNRMLLRPNPPMISYRRALISLETQ
jgi:hypothetical protein